LFFEKKQQEYIDIHKIKGEERCEDNGLITINILYNNYMTKIEKNIYRERKNKKRKKYRRREIITTLADKMKHKVERGIMSLKQLVPKERYSNIIFWKIVYNIIKNYDTCKKRKKRIYLLSMILKINKNLMVMGLPRSIRASSSNEAKTIVNTLRIYSKKKHIG